jgi:hypothetical protein
MLTLRQLVESRTNTASAMLAGQCSTRLQTGERFT